MIKFKKATLGALLSVAAIAATSCGQKKKEVEFWSAFGSKYGAKLQTIVDGIGEKLGFEIAHKAISGYDNILSDMTAALSTETYPDIAVGYPDHFAGYHGSKILRPMEDLVKDFKSDYYEAYMPENYLYDKDGTQHLYGVPFNKSTELLGYNGVFVDFCAEHFSDPTLKVLPSTWDEWKTGAKAQKYKEGLDVLTNNTTGCWYAIQDADGTAHDFEASATAVAGKTLVFDYRAISKSQTALMSWDSTDNMFITLVRQWGSHYTELPESERAKSPLIRKGKILFANSANLQKTVDMLRYFNEMQLDGIFTVPQKINASYSSDAFKQGKVMFMVCSSGGLGYNTENWSQRFRVTTIPYKDADKKYVISQGANLCLTNRSEDPSKAIAVIKALTTGEFQAEWAIKTGYFPASKSAQALPKYQAFLNDTTYPQDRLAEVAFREGAKVNTDHYINASENWLKFVDDAFIGSSLIRQMCKNIVPNVFKNVGAGAADSAYIAEINSILNDNQITSNPNIDVDRA